MIETKRIAKINFLIGIFAGLTHGLIGLIVNHENFHWIYLLGAIFIAPLVLSIGLVIYTYLFFPIIKYLARKNLVDMD